MKNQNGLWLGGILILAGLLLLAGNLFHFDASVLCWPILLILVGTWLLLRPRMSLPGANSNLVFLGDIKRYGSWEVRPEDLLVFIADIDYDFRQAGLAAGETRLRITGFIADLDFIVPEGLGVKVVCNGFVSDVHFLGQRRQGFFTPVEFSTPGYEAAEKKIFVETACFIGDLSIK